MTRTIDKTGRIYISQKWLGYCTDSTAVISVGDGSITIQPYDPQKHKLDGLLYRRLDDHARIKIPPDILKGVGFACKEKCLFGRLPFMEDAQDIDNLKKAHTMITSASRRRTIYRTILSVDGETAKAHGLYERAAWQELVTNKIGVIAKEMDIDRKDFCWAASMHYTKGHPHVHIMYWDNGSKVRQEFVPDERFEIMAEHVRAEFGREIYAEEISERREGAKDIIDEARLELMSLCKEAAPEHGTSFWLYLPHGRGVLDYTSDIRPQGNEHLLNS